MSKPRPSELTHCVINCIDCGKQRTIRNQDKHQVVRCAECQRKYRIQRRRELREQEENNKQNV